MPLLDIRNLTVEIHTDQGIITALDKVNLTLTEGQIHGLVGESGSCKSILARTILGIYEKNWVVSADRMTFKYQENDIELQELSSSQRRSLMGREIAMIFQEPSTFLDPALPIGKQLQECLPKSDKKRWFWQKPKKDQARQWLHKVGIKKHDKVMKSYSWELSEGECQKIMIAMALANKPKLLIADEPTSAMESSTQAQIIRLLSKLNQTQNISILLVSHDIASLSRYCDRLTVLYCGQVMESGSAEDLKQTAKHPYTQALLNTMAMLENNITQASNTLTGNIPTIDNLPKGCRLGPRCPRAQKQCINAPSPRSKKGRLLSCHFPIKEQA
ncbi:oligopeptide/dipeptide ABC transporter ATP-binding protein [Paraferrimonas sp. SM1919]|uniref:oligopeptide/dipeptide ABC transporter ATP-binding protein n=1 Tax=Paraferrimonas sp. SM1919 TaxID=2662263 RepID=UPI0013D53C28|nr:oligopeptide/dipeptide ABC transporter ATP-binding protein [Paraferrimonas sp. SM1919]